MISEKTLISFDYAIKYLLKSKDPKDREIIEGFISALLATEGHKPVKITALLDPESNKEDKELKRSVADLMVEDTEGQKYIVEIERSFTPNFAHKACFNTSRLVVDNLGTSQDYTQIKKIFHISLLYFATSEMRKPIYHGKTIIHEVDTSHPLDVKIANQGLVMFESHNVFPEYFFISVPMFNDVINQELDEWLYVMKHSEVKESFHSPYMSLISERLSVLKMSDEERNKYYKYINKSVKQEDVLNAAEEKGREKGLKQGMQKGIQQGLQQGADNKAIEIARQMIKKGMDLQLVSDLTGLSITDLEKLS